MNVRQSQRVLNAFGFQIYCVVKSVVVGTLVGEGANNARLDVNQRLIRENYAEKVEESYISKVLSYKSYRYKLIHVSDSRHKTFFDTYVLAQNLRNEWSIRNVLHSNSSHFYWMSDIQYACRRLWRTFGF